MAAAAGSYDLCLASLSPVNTATLAEEFTEFTARSASTFHNPLSTFEARYVFFLSQIDIFHEAIACNRSGTSTSATDTGTGETVEML